MATIHRQDGFTGSTRILSPLRYPGGKGGLAKLLAIVLQINDCARCHYYEPFAGGAGAALRLLVDGIVGELFLNDADPCVYAFWVSALRETERFVDRILSIPLTIEEWRCQQAICFNPTAQSTFDVGFATFYLNRCNRSGILVGAGPIGGYAQRGKWRLDERFNRENLVSRILQLSQYRDSIHIYNLDAIAFLRAKLPMGKRRRAAFVYLDPPYFTAGRRLYLNSYRERDHRALARYVLHQKKLKWIMTYDDSEFIRQIYQPCEEYIFSLRYSLQKKQEAGELLIAPHHLMVPSYTELGEIKMDLQPIQVGYIN